MTTEIRKLHLYKLKPEASVSVVDDEVALDEPTCIFVNGDYIATLISTPEMRKELTVGYLISEGVIRTLEDVKEIGFRENDILIELNKEIDVREALTDTMNLIVTACASRPRKSAEAASMPIVESDLHVNASKIVGMMAGLNKRCRIHFETGGTHAAMLCDDAGDTLAFAEDVGRHNAVDKVIGSMVLGGGDPGKCILLSTGRQSGEMIQKVARAGIPIVAAMAVPLSSGIRLAEMTGVALCYLWRGSLKVYANPQRIKPD